MPQLPKPINLANVEASTPRTDGPIPPAWYKATISKITIEPTQAGDDSLRIFFRLSGGMVAGFEQRAMFNIWHSTSEKARNISASELKSLQVAIGAPEEITNTDVLLGREVDVKIGPQKNEPKYSEVKGYAVAGTESATPENVAAQNTPVASAAAEVAGAIAQPGAVAPPPAAVAHHAPAQAPQPAPAPAPQQAAQPGQPTPPPTTQAPGWAQS